VDGSAKRAVAVIDTQRGYFESFPDGRERQSWPGITYIRARPTWLRFSDFGPDPPEIIEFDRAELVLD
jgi:hypothetical protein